jgi:hypothetical protein
MSLAGDDLHIVCDAVGCEATSRAPIGLRPKYAVTDSGPADATGWLFIVQQSGTKHFCPRCAMLQIMRARGGACSEQAS